MKAYALYMDYEGTIAVFSTLEKAVAEFKAMKTYDGIAEIEIDSPTYWVDLGQPE